MGSLFSRGLSNCRMTSENPTRKIKEGNQFSSIIRGRIMNCFNFSNMEKKVGQKTIKSTSVRSWASSSSGCDMKRSGSEFNMSSEMSAESIGRSTFPSFSQKSNNLRVFNYSELKTATKNFNRSLMIGEGGFGCVYRGVIKSSEDPHNKLDVAVKQLSRRGLQGHKEWVTEVNVLGVVEHPNLVKLVGYCAEDDERGIQRLLVYEYMPNRSVEDHLSTRSPAALPWAMRLKIAQDAARGLAHLHEKMDFQIIFRDFKASNILLDEQWNAKLSDFGLARQGPSEGLSHVSTAVVGTIGYAAPEYIRTGRLTAKSDVWSYGVFLYELITGRRPLDRNRPKSEQNLLEWVKPYLSDSKKFQLILDPRLEGKYPLKSVQKLAAVANRCLVRYPKARPTMTEVLGMVDQIVAATDVGSIQPPITSLSTRNVGSPQPPTRSPSTSDVGSRQPSNRSLSTSDGGNPQQPIKSLSTTDSPKEFNRKQSSSKKRIVDLGFCQAALSVWRKWTPKLIKTS